MGGSKGDSPVDGAEKGKNREGVGMESLMGESGEGGEEGEREKGEGTTVAEQLGEEGTML